MADSLREYLVSLGFSIDEPSWQKYTHYVALASKTTAELGSIAIETATGIELAVAKVARQYESLYYVSRRTGQSAQYIQSAQFAYKQMGLSADDATDAIEGVAHAMRTQPGLAALFGGATKPEDIVDKLRGMPYFIAQQFGAMAGLSEKTFQHIWMFGPQEKAAAEDHKKRLQAAGIDADKSAVRFTDFGRTLNHLEDDFEILGTRIALDWVDPVEHGIEALDRAVQWFTKMDEATDGWIGTLSSLAGTVGGSWMLTALFKKLFGIGGAAAAAATATSGAAAAGGGAVAAGGAAAAGGAGILGMAGLGAMGAGAIGATLLYPSSIGAEGETSLTRAGRAGGGGGAQTPRDRVAAAIQFFMSQGYSREAAIGIASSLYLESDRTLSPTAFNPAGGGQGAIGIGQWRGARADAFKQKYGKDLKDASFEEQLAYVAYEMSQGKDFGALRAGQMLRGGGLGAGQSAETFLRLFERPGPAGEREIVEARSLADDLSSKLAATQGGGDTSVHVNMKTDIHVAAGPTALSTAQAVMGAQDKVSQSTTRALVGAMR